MLSDQDTRINQIVAVEDDNVQLLIENCAKCDANFFPGNGYGCKACGASPENLSTRKTSSRAKVLANTTLMISPGSGLRTPAVIAQLELIEPKVRFYAILDGELLSPDDVVEAMPPTDGGETFELKFREMRDE